MAESMDQAMIDALLAGNAKETEEPVNENPTGPMDQAMIDALLAGSAEEEEVAEEPVNENPTGPMDQAMIDALLAGSAEEAEVAEEPVNENSTGPMDQAMLDALLVGSVEETELAEEPDMENNGDLEAASMIDTVSLAAELENEPVEEVVTREEEPVSMLAQLMAEMEEEVGEGAQNSFDEDDLMSEDSIEALLSAAKSSADSIEEEVSYEMPNVDEMAEIEALLGMSESEEVVDENTALLKMLEEAGSFTPEEEQVKAVDIAELDSLLSVDSSEKSDAEESQVEEPKEVVKKKGFFEKIFSALVEEVPEEVEDKDRINLSDENKEILEQLEKEDSKKLKAKEKKEKREQAKKEKKEAKEKKAQEKKAQEKKEKKEKKVKVKKEKPMKLLEAPEKKLPKKKVMVTFAFAFSVLAAILIIVMLIPPIFTVNRARSAYDKGEYLEAYKEYYGQKLSEEDEKKFQAATVVLRMKSNLDGYHSYLKFGDKVHALHSLLEAVHVRDDVFAKAQEFDVLAQVSTIYSEILDLLNIEFSLTEEDAMDLVKEKSDVTYTKKLQALTEGTVYKEETLQELNQEDLLPGEEQFLDAN